MKKTKFTECQIIGMLKQYESGSKINDLCREHGISQPTFLQGREKPVDSVLAVNAECYLCSSGTDSAEEEGLVRV